ncbi:MAG: hypothetical protein IKB30_02360 [Clostridia bacterium]|nr:hypothetical protein [Clostridia bacterium]
MHARKIKYNKIFSFILAMLFFVSALSVCDFTAHADANVYPFDNTDVMTDLESSDEFVLSDYYWDKYGIYRSPELVNFVEWCYSPFQPDDFALYIYFYNPQGVDIDEDNPSNRIQIASAYNAYPITRESVPSDYSTYPLVFCSMSTRENYEGMFYKFRVVDQKGADGLYIQDRVYSGERRYDVSGVVLADETGDVKEFGVGGTYYFSGYAAGYGPNEFSESTLTNTGFQPLETISLEVHPTNYRTGSSNVGAYHQHDINSVYFSVPERYFTEYGDLQKIKAEWYEYKTKEILIIKNTSMYNAVKPYIGKNIGDYASGLNWEFYNKRTDQSDLNPSGYYDYETTYNVKKNTSVVGTSKDVEKNQINTLYWVLSSSNGKISSSKIVNYIYNYGTGSLLAGERTISEDLFLDSVDEGRTKGYNSKEIDANAEFDLLSYDSTHDWVQKFRDYGFFAPETGGTLEGVFPVVTLSTDIEYEEMSDSNISNTLLINLDDAAAFKSFYSNAKANDERTVLFRFANTDYYYEGLYENDRNAVAYVSQKGDKSALAQMSVFFDFKIIHLTFQKDGTFKVIPVTQNPIDVINDITPTPGAEAPDWWKAFVEWLLGLLETIGAWGAAIVGVVALVLIITIALKLLQLAQGAGSAVLRIIFILAILAAGIAGGYYVGKFFFDIVISLGGLW